MIPASYLFKDVFQQSFYDPDIAEAATRHRRMQTGRHIFSWLRRQSPDVPTHQPCTNLHHGRLAADL